VTEIPEHLLKRSKERRAAIGGEPAPGDEATAAATPATTEAAEAPAPAAAAAAPAVPAELPAPEPPKPLRPEVAAAMTRRKIPYWALPVLLALPLWAYVYQGTLEPPPEPEAGVLALGEEVYGQCAACHGATGGGVSGPPLTDVLTTWPDWRDHLAWVAVGSQGWPADTYGADDRPKNGGMPAFASILSEEELAQVVLYERVEFGALEEGSEEYLALERVAHGESTFADEGLGPESTEAGVDPAAVTPAG
jgi:mono/diheme cytochrome c family protein